LPYPPDALPGGRFVESPYGTIRVYEWGPEDGTKVFLIHGINTAAISLGAVAHALADNGCRVMLMDTWGRGYSDTPADLEHDDRLFATEILIAVTSSTLSWIGGPDGGFNLIGYSFGGGIAVNFAAYFGHMVNSLVLFAPSGLIRKERLKNRSRFLLGAGLMPKWALDIFIVKRLQAGPMFPKEDKDGKIGVGEAVEAEVTEMPLSRAYPDVTVRQAMSWLVGAHKGFPTSFMSTVRFGPLFGQHATWKRLRSRKDKILIFIGSKDPVCIAHEFKEDVEELLGKDKVRIVELDTEHDFPHTHVGEIMKPLSEFWNL